MSSIVKVCSDCFKSSEVQPAEQRSRSLVKRILMVSLFAFTFWGGALAGARMQPETSRNIVAVEPIPVPTMPFNPPVSTFPPFAVSTGVPPVILNPNALSLNQVGDLLWSNGRLTKKDFAARLNYMDSESINDLVLRLGSRNQNSKISEEMVFQDNDFRSVQSQIERRIQRPASERPLNQVLVALRADRLASLDYARLDYSLLSSQVARKLFADPQLESSERDRRLALVPQEFRAALRSLIMG